MEYLLGRSLINGLASLDGDLVQEAREALAELGYDLERVAQEEIDPGLGNGGLGRLAACFLDSLATLQFPGGGLRHPLRLRHLHPGHRRGRPPARDRQHLDARAQPVGNRPRRRALRHPLRRPLHRHAGGCGGRPRYRWVDTHNIWAVGFDQLIPGNRSPTVNHLRLWAGRAIAPFNVETFNAGRHAEASAEQVDAKNVSRILYPDDTTPQGKELRFKQQYFFVSASLQDILAQHLAEGRQLRHAAGRDRDPAERHAPGARDTRADAPAGGRARSRVGPAWDITRRVFSYTNHTLLPEALEVWPVAFFERVLPRHLQIIYVINRALARRSRGALTRATTSAAVACR